MSDFILVKLYLAACLLFIAVVCWVQHNRRTVLLISARNLFLAGFSYFQIISVWYWLNDQQLYRDTWKIYRANKDVGHFVAMSLLFLASFFLAYKIFRVVEKNPSRFTFRSGATNEGFLLVMALVMSMVSFGLQLGASNRYVSILATYSGISMGAAACGIAAWVLIGRYSNPIVVLYCFGLFAINMVGQLGGFSRRGLLSMGLAIIWCFFYRYLHVKRTGRLVFFSLVLFLPSLFVVAGFTAIRKFEGMSQKEAIGKLGVESLQDGISRLIGPTDTGPVTLWLIENYPEKYDYRHMFTPMYTFGHFVPRAWWNKKPDTLSNIAVEQSGRSWLGTLNVGPGIIGHAAAEGGYYAVVVYAVLAALITKLVDELAKYNNMNPYVVVPLGAALAEVFASARGETSYMIGVGACGTICVIMFMWFIVMLTSSGRNSHYSNAYS